MTEKSLDQRNFAQSGCGTCQPMTTPTSNQKAVSETKGIIVVHSYISLYYLWFLGRLVVACGMTIFLEPELSGINDLSILEPNQKPMIAEKIAMVS